MIILNKSNMNKCFESQLVNTGLRDETFPSFFISIGFVSFEKITSDLCYWHFLLLHIRIIYSLKTTPCTIKISLLEISFLLSSSYKNMDIQSNIDWNHIEIFYFWQEDCVPLCLVVTNNITKINVMLISRRMIWILFDIERHLHFKISAWEG